MTRQPGIQAHEPPAGEGPSREELAERERLLALHKAGSAPVREAAATWGTGLTGLIGLVTGGLLLKGPEAAQELPTEFRLTISALLVGGLGLAILGLWKTLSSSAGSPETVLVQEMRDKAGTVAGYEEKVAAAASARLDEGKRRVGWALALLLAGLLVWWWAPSEKASPLASVSVADESDPICGKLLSADDQIMRVQVEGERNPREIAFAEVENVSLTTEC